jgi:MFS family permease
VSSQILLLRQSVVDLLPKWSLGKLLLSLYSSVDSYDSPNIATAIGPILGGALADFANWRWIFWLLTILSATCLLMVVLLLPETSRQIVGDGSRPGSAIHRSLISLVFPRRSKDIHKSSQQESDLAEQANPPRARKFQIPNPIASLKLLWAKDTILITLIFGIFYMNLSCLQASTSTLFIQLYGISEFKAGLVYLPSGIGSCIGVYCCGKTIITFNYVLR